MKIIRGLFIVCLWLSILPVYAANQSEEQVPEDPMTFEISVQPKKTAAEADAERWLGLMSNETGIYLFEPESIKKVDNEGGGVWQQVLTRSVFKDPKILTELDKAYATKLNNGENIGYCEMLLVFDLQKRQYQTQQTQIYTKLGRLVEEYSLNNNVWKKILKQSFAEALLQYLKHNPDK